MNIKLAVKNQVAGRGTELYNTIEDAEYEDAQYDILGSFLIITLSNGPEKVFPVGRVYFMEVTP